MTRSILKLACLAGVLSVVPARASAVWPPSTAFELERHATPAEAPSEALPAALHRDGQEVLNKLEEDARRLAKVVQDLNDDEAQLQASSKDLDAHGGPHS